MTRGGARPGAGRPRGRVKPPPRQIVLRLPPSLVEAVDAALLRGESRNGFCANAIAEELRYRRAIVLARGVTKK